MKTGAGQRATHTCSSKISGSKRKYVASIRSGAQNASIRVDIAAAYRPFGGVVPRQHQRETCTRPLGTYTVAFVKTQRFARRDEPKKHECDNSGPNVHESVYSHRRVFGVVENPQKQRAAGRQPSTMR